MLLMECHYDQPEAGMIVKQALETILPPDPDQAVFLCIGSDRHILDSFGPLTGSLLQEGCGVLHVYGTLNQPLHAGNLVAQLDSINSRHFKCTKIAVDASAGRQEELGLVRLRDEPLLPGRALLKKLPPLGNYTITGVLSLKGQGRFKNPQDVRLNTVYKMARLVSQAVASFYDIKAAEPSV